jgi:predicted small secreted protein
MSKFLLFTMLGGAAAGVSLMGSCAATKGLGQDLQKVGNRIEDRADATGGARPDPGVDVTRTTTTRTTTTVPTTVYPAPY